MAKNDRSDINLEYLNFAHFNDTYKKNLVGIYFNKILFQTEEYFIQNWSLLFLNSSFSSALQ